MWLTLRTGLLLIVGILSACSLAPAIEASRIVDLTLMLQGDSSRDWATRIRSAPGETVAIRVPFTVAGEHELVLILERILGAGDTPDTTELQVSLGISKGVQSESQELLLRGNLPGRSWLHLPVVGVYSTLGAVCPPAVQWQSFPPEQVLLIEARVRKE